MVSVPGDALLMNLFWTWFVAALIIIAGATLLNFLAVIFHEGLEEIFPVLGDALTAGLRFTFLRPLGYALQFGATAFYCAQYAFSGNLPLRFALHDLFFGNQVVDVTNWDQVSWLGAFLLSAAGLTISLWRLMPKTATNGHH